jgi:tetratricopeptide (TPR) repeat protein
MSPADSSANTGRRLDTWKEIGAFFGRDERTVKRWETRRGLPVHRVPGAGRANVYANTNELLEWLKGNNTPNETDKQQDTHVSPAIEAGVEFAAGGHKAGQAFADERHGEQRETDRTRTAWPARLAARYVLMIVAAAAMALLIVGALRHIASVRAERAEAVVARRHAIDPQAEQFYLQGLYYWHKRTPEALHQAVDYFTQAVVRDPQYAQAYVGLADCYNLLREYSLMTPEEAYPRAMAAAKRAIALDDSLSGAHSSLGFVDFYWSWDVSGAQREFDRALALDPNSVIAHHWYATFLLHLGRFEESLAEIEKAQKLDPNSSAILADKALVLFYHGERDQAIVLLKQLEASEPNYLSPHSYLASMYLAQGKYPQYLTEYRKAVTMLHDQPRLAIVAAGEKGLTHGGFPGMLNAMLKEQQRLYASDREPAYGLARSYALLEKKSEALDNLQISVSKRESEILKMRIDPTLFSLHSEPRFQKILAETGLPPLP